jgi:hypothetical protein
MGRKKKDIYDVYPPFNYQLGRPLKYEPDELLEKFQEYIKWAKEHPIPIVKNVKNTTTKGDTYGSDSLERKPRLLSISGFLVFIGAGSDWWQSLDRDGAKRAEEFSRVKSLIREFCQSYQSEMASADIFNANIVSRLLGLADKKDITSNGDKFKIVVESKEDKEMFENFKNLPE